MRRIADPDHSLHTARECMRDGRLDEAIALLTRISHASPGNVAALVELAQAYQLGDRYDAARFVFERAVEQSCGDAIVRLRLAHLLELDARPEEALLQTFRALADAQRKGITLDRGSDTRELTAHARDFVKLHRRAWFGRVLAPLRARDPVANWKRVDDTLAVYLRERTAIPADARQRAGFMFVPDLPSSPLVAFDQFDWNLDDAARSIRAVRDEIDACSGADGTMVVFHRGITHFHARMHTPRLIAAFEALPLARVPNHAPDCEVATLAPHARTQRYFGLTNSRCRVAVNVGDAPLEVGVANESRILAPGQVLAFDATFGVEFANRASVAARMVAMDVWHPDLSATERSGLTALIAAAVAFDTRVMELP